MQRLKDNFDPATMREWHALIIPQPFASAVCERGQHIEIVSRPVKYRGTTLICSAHAPHFPHLYCGATIGIAELVACKPVREIGTDEWRHTRLRREKWGKMQHGYALYFTDCHRVIEIPCSARKGFRTLFFDTDDITEYPRQVYLDNKAWRKIHKK